MLQRSLFVGTIIAQNRLLRNAPALISFSDGGYAGSTYSSNRGGGQWYADETAIPGATSQTYIMTAENEGKTITYRIDGNSSNAIRLFTPNNLSGLVSWFDASALSTLTLSGNAVVQWNSRVGDHNVFQSTSSRRPTWSATGRNGLPAIQGNVANNTALEFSTTAPIPMGSNPSHTFAVAQQGSSTSWRGLSQFGSGTGGQTRYILQSSAGFVGLFTGVPAGDNVSTSTWIDSDRIVAAATISSRSTLHVDGSNTPTTTTVALNTVGNFGMLMNTTSNQAWSGTLQEFFIFNRELTDVERQLVEGYLAAKWNLRALLPVDHPYKNTFNFQFPVISLQSGTGYFGSVYESTLGGGQWYADETPIAGATSQTYVMEATNEGKSLTYRINGINSNSIRVYVPSHISGLVAWFDAADTNTLTLSGSLVAEWRSKVGIVRGIQNTSGSRPTWSATGRNNLPAIVASANKFLDLTDTTALPSGPSSSHVFATAYSSSANTGYRQLYNQGSLSAGQGRVILRLNTGAVTATASGATFDTGTSTWTDQDRLVQAAFATGTAIRLGVDGSSTLTAKTGLTYSTVNTNTRLLAPIDGRSNEHWEGSIQEFMIFSRELAVFERQLIEGYMAAKWNLRSLLPVGHPYKTTMPINIPVITLGSGTGYFGSTFVTTDTGGQWYADDTAISGATGSTYTLTAENEGKSITYRNSNGISNTLRYFVPPDVSVIVAWWDAAATTTLTRVLGGEVSSWASRVGTATWAQGTSANRPTWSVTGRNGLPAVTSNGTSQRMTYSNGVLPTGTNVSHTMFLGFNSGGSGSFRCLMNWSSASGGTGRYFGHNNSVNVTFTGANTTTDNFTTVSWANQDKIMSTQVTGTASTINVDGSTTAFTKTATYNTTVNTSAALFSTISSGQYWQGSAQDLIVYNRALTLADRQRVEGYMAAKWNLRSLLPSDHPFKSATPL